MLYRSIACAALAIGVKAEYTACGRPSGEWVAIDQGNGRSQVYGVTVGKGNNVFAAGYTYGNMTFTGIHASDGVFGEQTDHTAIGPPDHTDTTSIFHNSKTILGGRYTDEANSQHGSDGIIYKMNADGDPAAIYAVDIMPADGKLEDSINGGWGGWAYFYNIKQVGSTKDLIAIGNFRGNLTVPIGSDSSTVLHNPKNGQTDGFVVKLDGDNMQAAWAKAPGQFADGRNYFRNLAMDSADNAIITSEVRPSKKYQMRIQKVDGDGDVVWAKTTFGEDDGLGGGDALDVIGTDIYVGGEVYADGDHLGLGAMTGGQGFVALLGSDGVATHMAQVGEEVKGIVASTDGAHIFAVGEGEEAWTSGSCSLTGATKGFLVKLDATDLSCVWAKDIGEDIRYLVADDDYVYGSGYGSSANKFDDELTIRPRGPENSAWVLKWKASDGVGQWGMSIGGTGDDYLRGMTLSAAGGVIIAGYTYSGEINLAGTVMKNLQHARGEARGGSTTAANVGHLATFIGELSATEATPSCLSSCSTSTSTATIASGKCYPVASGTCYADGAADEFLACFKCDASASQTAMTGPDHTNHCFMDGNCIATGTMAPSYQKYNNPSACEWCDPAVNPTGYSLKPMFVHDRDLARDENGRNGRRLASQTNKYGMIFDTSSNGCQMLPSLTIPDDTAGLTAAAAAKKVVTGAIADAPTEMAKIANDHSAALLAEADAAAAGTGSFAGVDADSRKAYVDASATDAIPVTNALKAVEGGKSTLANWQSAWAYYSGNEASCTKTDSVTCEYTPSATAGAHAHADIFNTDLHYGHAVAVVKTQQSMSLGAAEAEATAADAALSEAFLIDTKMHMLVPYFQGVIAMANQMDTATTATAKKTAQLKGYAYYSLVMPTLSPQGADAAADVAVMFHPSSAVSGTKNYCKVKALVESQLPNASSLQYTFGYGAVVDRRGNDRAATEHSAVAADALDTLTLEDIGDLTGAPTCPNATDDESSMASTAAVSFEVTAGGSVSDYTDIVKMSMRTKIAAALAVSYSATEITVAAASSSRRRLASGVKITIIVKYATSADASAGAATLTAAMSDPAAASALLSTPYLAVTVSSIDVAPAETAVNADGTVVEGSSLGGGEIAGIIIGSIAGVVIIVGLIVWAKKRSDKGVPIFTCLDEPLSKDKNKGTETTSTSKAGSAA